MGRALKLSILAADFCPSPKKAQPAVQGPSPDRKAGVLVSLPPSRAAASTVALIQLREIS